MRRKECNYYAVHYMNPNLKDRIFDTWASCRIAIKGQANKYKGFQTEEEAREWLWKMSAEHQPKK